MAEQKLTYKVEADTSGAVRSLGDLGDAGEAAGKQIADGFDTATSQSKQAISALTAELDKVEADAKATASAVSAIKAHLTVDVDDAKVAQFATDIKSKMGVTFDQIEADAKGFADVLERGVNLDRTRAEIRGVGDALDHTRGEADQSRSVLANLAGNSAQSLGELGGVVGDLGLGIGQLAEYAVDGNIKLANLAGLAGPMAGLAAAGIGVQQLFKSFTETKAFDKKQVEDFGAAIDAVGNSYAALLQVATDQGLQARVEGGGLLGEVFPRDKTVDLLKLLDSLGLKLADVQGVIRSGTGFTEFGDFLRGGSADAVALNDTLARLESQGFDTTAMMSALREVTAGWADANLTAETKARVLGSTLGSVNDELDALAVQEDPLAVLSQGAIQFGQVMVDPVLLWHQLVDDLRDGKADIEGSALAIDAFAAAMGIGTDQVEALAIQQGEAAKSAGDLQGAQRDAAETTGDAAQAYRDQADAIQDTIDKTQDLIDASHDWADSQQDFRDATADLDQTMADTNATMANTVPGLEDYTEAQREQRDTAEDWIDQLVATRQEFDRGRGVVRTASQTQDDYAEGLGRIASHLNASVIPSVARYYANLLQIPDDKITEFEIVLATGDQDKIEAFVAENSGTKQLAVQVVADQAKLAKVSGAIHALEAPVSTTVHVHANTTEAYDAKRRLQAPWFTTLWVTPRATTATIGGRTVDFGSRTVNGQPVTQTTRAVGDAATGPTVEAFAVDDAGVALATTSTLPGAPSGSFGPTTAAPPARPVNVNVTVNAAVIGNRFDVERAVLRSVRRGVRIRGAGALVSP